MSSSPYAVPLADLETRVAEADQTTGQAVPRTAHLPGDPALWSAGAVPAAGDEAVDAGLERDEGVEHAAARSRRSPRLPCPFRRPAIILSTFPCGCQDWRTDWG